MACEFRVYLHLPEGGTPNEPKTEIVRWKGKLFQTDAAPQQPAKPLPGSILGYSVNGKWQVRAPNHFCSGVRSHIAIIQLRQSIHVSYRLMAV